MRTLKQWILFHFVRWCQLCVPQGASRCLYALQKLFNTSNKASKWNRVFLYTCCCCKHQSCTTVSISIVDVSICCNQTGHNLFMVCFRKRFTAWNIIGLNGSMYNTYTQHTIQHLLQPWAQIEMLAIFDLGLIHWIKRQKEKDEKIQKNSNDR